MNSTNSTTAEHLEVDSQRHLLAPADKEASAASDRPHTEAPVPKRKRKFPMSAAKTPAAIRVDAATLDDVPGLVDAAREFYDAIKAEERFGPFDEQAIAHTLTQMIIADRSAVLVARNGTQAIVGCCPLVAVPSMFAPGNAMAQSFFWWVEREHSGREIAVAMMREGERIAREMGANVMTFGVSRNTPQASRLCIERGYKLGESHYWRKL